jgi:hypothetical protein
MEEILLLTPRVFPRDANPCQSSGNGVKSVKEMITMKKLKINWDLTLSILAAIIVYLALPYHNPALLLKPLYGMGLVVLTILFAELGAAMLLLQLLQKKNDQPDNASPDSLWAKNRFAVKMSFSALLYFAAQYGHIAYLAHAVPGSDQNKTWITIGSLLFLLALTAVFRVMLETVRRLTCS